MKSITRNNRKREYTAGFKIEVQTFKNKINTTIPLSEGNERQFCFCPECYRISYYDYLPYSLSNPIITSPCLHRIENYQKLN